MHTDEYTEILPGHFGPSDDSINGTFRPCTEEEPQLPIGWFGGGNAPDDEPLPQLPSRLGRALSLTIELRFCKVR
jgi:hypothetical protein